MPNFAKTHMKNNPYIIAGAVIVILALIFGGKALSDKKADQDGLVGTNDSGLVATSTNPDSSNTSMNKGPIGGQKDANGCITSAGYSWDSEIGSCIRSWEKLTTFVPMKKWYFVENGHVVSKNIFFTMDQNSKISGRICNSFGGTAKFDNRMNTITSGPLTATLMACLDTTVSNLESKFFRVMNGTANVSLNTDTGILTFKKGAESMEFTTNEHEGFPDEGK